MNPCGIISVCVKSGELRNTSRPSVLSAVPVRPRHIKLICYKKLDGYSMVRPLFLISTWHGFKWLKADQDHNLEIIQLQLPQTMFGIPLTKWAPRALSFTKLASGHLFFVLLVDLPDSIDLFAFGNPDKITPCKAILASKLLQGSGECPQDNKDGMICVLDFSPPSPSLKRADTNHCL